MSSTSISTGPAAREGPLGRAGLPGAAQRNPALEAETRPAGHRLMALQRGGGTWQEHRPLLGGQGDPETACGRSSLDKGCLPFISGDEDRLDPL